ncbi:MAG: kelch repeat-containing protein, partial [Polyangiales bacterium]
PAHLGVAGHASSWIELSPIDLRDRPAEVVAGAVVFRDAAPDTDVVWLGDRSGAEELRVLNGPKAKSTALHRLTHGAEVAAIRVKQGSSDVIEVVDHQGEVRIASAPMFAIDAHGVRRPVRAKLLPGDVLETSVDTSDLAYPIVVDPSWSTVAPMATARSGHTATTLKGDVVLVTGGVDASGAYLSSAELFDAATKTWTTTTPMSAKRSGHTATLLSTGKVVIVGGTSDGSTSLSTAQIYDLATKTWSGAASMSEVRNHHTATLLAGDKILIVGGSDFSPGGESATAEIYDVAKNSWSSAGTMSVGKQEHTATLLASGLVLVTGGRRGGGMFHKTTELFDPTSLTWTKASDMATARSLHAAALLSGDRVLVTGGRAMDSFGVIQTWDKAEIYDPTTKTWKGTSAPMAAKREGHTATALPQDRVLVVGGDGTSSVTTTNVELFESSIDRFVAFAPLAAARTGHASAQLSNRDLLVTGGTGTTATTSVELLTLGALGDACKDGLAECASGLCVDGVCCDSACTGQCEACDLPASKGTCSAVSGAAHPGRTACSDGGGGCQAKHCDGMDRTSCAAFADTTTVCASASCADGAAKPIAHCDGKGTCSAVTSASCAPYACGDMACKTSCASDADCSGSNVCDKATGKCVVADSTCTEDGLSSQPLDRSQPPKDCAPYRCEGTTGKCFDRCTVSDVCAPGAACDAPTGTCVATAAKDDSGGCALGTPRGSAAGLALAGLALVLAASRRRRNS